MLYPLSFYAKQKKRRENVYPEQICKKQKKKKRLLITNMNV